MKYIIDNQSDMSDISAAWFAATAYKDLIYSEATDDVDGVVTTTNPKSGMIKGENKEYAAY